ncbi:MAG: hypothetical protein KGJ64_13595 [Betaproteobacteria bacterium]|nr:hypothetical protein [Betaproteobacteria bacterium]
MLLRQYLPQGTDLSVYVQGEGLYATDDSPNTPPHATLNWNSPLQVFAQLLANPMDGFPVQ